MILWRPTRLPKTKTKKRCLFHHGAWNANVASQEISVIIGKFGFGVQNEARQMLTEFCQVSTLIIANTLFQQHKRQLCTWTSTNGQYQNQIDYILCSQKWRSSIQSAKTRPGADHDQIMSSLLQNSGSNWRSRENHWAIQFDLNQILYAYTAKLTNKFKGLDLIERLKNDGWGL